MAKPGCEARRRCEAHPAGCDSNPCLAVNPVTDTLDMGEEGISLCRASEHQRPELLSSILGPPIPFVRTWADYLGLEESGWISECGQLRSFLSAFPAGLAVIDKAVGEDRSAENPK